MSVMCVCVCVYSNLSVCVYECDNMSRGGGWKAGGRREEGGRREAAEGVAAGEQRKTRTPHGDVGYKQVNVLIYFYVERFPNFRPAG